MAESPFTTLERWEAAGARWRLRWCTADEAEVDLLTCLGEPVDRLRSTDPRLVAYVRDRPTSED